MRAVAPNGPEMVPEVKVSLVAFPVRAVQYVTGPLSADVMGALKW